MSIFEMIENTIYSIVFILGVLLVAELRNRD